MFHRAVALLFAGVIAAPGFALAADARRSPAAQKDALAK